MSERLREAGGSGRPVNGTTALCPTSHPIHTLYPVLRCAVRPAPLTLVSPPPVPPPPPPLPPPAGSWRGLVDELEYVEAMPVEDVVRVTRTVFDDANCFTGYIDPAKA